MVTIYRVGDSIDSKRHLAYSDRNSSFCGRVPLRRKWMIMSRADLPLLGGATLCRQCERSRLNTTSNDEQGEGRELLEGRETY